jgi:hypothetical protein
VEEERPAAWAVMEEDSLREIAGFIVKRARGRVIVISILLHEI